MNWDIDYSRYYGSYHSNSSAHIRWQIGFNRRILRRHLPIRRNTPALDIGCGMGFAMQYLREEGYDPVEGIDIDVSQVETCRQQGLTVFHTGDAAGFLSERDQKYGVILAMDVLEHMSADEQLSVARSVYSALLPGGRFICSVPNANSSVASRQRYNDFTHQSSFTEHSLDFLLFNSGFHDISIHAYEFYVPALKLGLKPGDFARPQHFVSFLAKDTMRNVAFCVTRGWRRVEMIGEFGFDIGNKIPLTLNLLGIASKT